LPEIESRKKPLARGGARRGCQQKVCDPSTFVLGKRAARRARWPDFSASERLDEHLRAADVAL
jgi:hypothetical protein